MACKQIALNVIEWIKPILTVKPKLMKLKEKYYDTIQEYDFDPTEQPLKAGKKESSEKPSIREYQAIRDLALAPGGAGVIDCYMELVAQFGFIVLFSEIFPPAALFSLICNNIQISSQINNFSYERRFKAEISNGIGEFMNCLEILVKLAIISNMGTLFFTSRTMIKLFIGRRDSEGAVIVDPDYGTPFFPSWNKLEFAIFVLSVEHILIIMQMFIGIIIDDKPDYVIHGEREQKDLLDNFKRRVHNNAVSDENTHAHDAEEIRERIS